MSGITAEKVKDAVASIQLDSSSRRSAVRAITGFREKDASISEDDSTIILYLALHSLLAPLKNKVTPDLLKSLKSEAFTSAFGSRMFAHQSGGVMADHRGEVLECRTPIRRESSRQHTLLTQPRSSCRQG